MSNCFICGKKIGFGTGSRYFAGKDICNECLTKIGVPTFAYNLKSLPRTKGIFNKVYNAKKSSKQSMLENGIPNDKINVIMTYYDNFLDEFPNEIKAEYKREINEKTEAENLYKERIAHCLLTTSDNFEGYKIMKYIDIITSEYTLGTGFFSSVNSYIADELGKEASSYTKKIHDAKEKALKRLTREAVNRNGNGIIGVRIDIETFSRDIIAVSAMGTCVNIQKTDQHS